jgi:hypothetical protein
MAQSGIFLMATNTIDSRCPLICPHKAIGVTQDVSPIHLVIEKVKPKSLLLLGLLV